MDPESVGQHSTLVLGKHSGRAAFADALVKLGIKLEDEDFQRSFSRFKELADRKGEISEEGLRAIVASETDTPTAAMTLVSFEVVGGSTRPPVATVVLDRDGTETTASAEGDGMINAAFVALQDAFGIVGSLADYRVEPLNSGADAMAKVNVILQVGSSTYSGQGVSTDVVEGSARAIVSALNKATFDRGAIDGA